MKSADTPLEEISVKVRCNSHYRNWRVKTRLKSEHSPQMKGVTFCETLLGNEECSLVKPL